MSNVFSWNLPNFKNKFQNNSSGGFFEFFSYRFIEAATRACNFIKKETLSQVFSCQILKISSRTPLVAASLSFFIINRFIEAANQACNFIKKETLPQVFSCRFCQIFQIAYFYRTPFLNGRLNLFVQCYVACSWVFRTLSNNFQGTFQRKWQLFSASGEYSQLFRNKTLIKNIGAWLSQVIQ